MPKIKKIPTAGTVRYQGKNILQETTLVFDNKTGSWSVYSTVPKHIRKLSNLTEINVLESDNGRPIAIKATLSEKQVSMKKIRVMSESQKKSAAERMAKARSKQ